MLAFKIGFGLVLYKIDRGDKTNLNNLNSSTLYYLVPPPYFAGPGNLAMS